MARRVFFSFHYAPDIWRVNVVRNSGEFKDVEQSGFFDHSLWEEKKRAGDEALRKLIAEGLKNTTVSAVLTGSQTWARPWVRYELVRSLERGNGLINIFIDQVKNQAQLTATRGPNPLDYLFVRLTSDGHQADTWYHDGKEWQSYLRISAESLPPVVKKAKEGKFSAFFSSYDWVAKSGHDSFSKWVESAAKAAGKS